MSLLVAEGVAVTYRSHGHPVFAVRGVDLRVEPGECVGLVGESASGKSSLVRALLGLEPLARGRVVVADVELAHASRAELRRVRRRMQPVFQDASSALDPRLTIAEAIAEPLEVQDVGTAAERARAVERLLAQVHLPPDVAQRRPRELSAGQRQRVNIARALALEPELLLLDEPVSALDVSVQAQLLTLLAEQRAARPLAMVFVSHDLDVVAWLASRLVVLYAGRVVEEGPTAEVLAAPRHPYTRALVAARERRLTGPSGEPPSAVVDPPGCAFAPRCERATDACRATRPVLEGAGRRVACFAPVA